MSKADEYELIADVMGDGFARALDELQEAPYTLSMHAVMEKNVNFDDVILVRTYINKILDGVINDLRGISKTGLMQQRLEHLESLVKAQENERK